MNRLGKRRRRCGLVPALATALACVTTVALAAPAGAQTAVAHGPADVAVPREDELSRLAHQSRRGSRGLSIPAIGCGALERSW